jgi:hypothetical protein
MISLTVLGTMAPSYNTMTPAPPINPGNSVDAFRFEQPASGTFSQQYAVPPSSNAGGPPSVSIQVKFAGAPGAFEFDIYESDGDGSSNDYLQIPTAGSITTVSSNNVARVDLSPFLGTYIAIYCKTANANAVNASVKITRKS